MTENSQFYIKTWLYIDKTLGIYLKCSIDIHLGILSNVLYLIRQRSKSLLKDLRAVDIGSRIAPEWHGTRIPTLEEILTLCHEKNETKSQKGKAK